MALAPHIFSGTVLGLTDHMNQDKKRNSRVEKHRKAGPLGDDTIAGHV